jgi:carboxyl-terminal processing protease
MKARSSRSLRVLALALALLAVLAVGVWLGGHPSWLPPSLRGALVADSEGQRVQNVLSLLEKNYYRRLDQRQLVNQGLEAAVASLHDPYSHYFPPTEFHQFMQITNPQFGGIGVEVLPNPRGLEVTQVFPGSPAARAGIGHGDLITAVGATSLAGRSEDSASGLIRGPIGSQVKLTVRQGERTRTYVLKRAQIVAPVAYSKLLRHHGLPIGYVQLTQFADNAGTELHVQVDKMLARGARALVLDLRGNGGGLLKQAIAVASIFVPHGTIVTTKGRNQPTDVYKATGGAIPTRIPMVVLVDHGTASSAEIVTAALQQHHRATVIGTHTYGKGVFQEIVNLPGGAALDMTVGEFFTPNGTNLGAPGVAQGRTLARGRGITPDVYAYTQPSSTTDTALLAAERVLAKQGG